MCNISIHLFKLINKIHINVYTTYVSIYVSLILVLLLLLLLCFCCLALWCMQQMHLCYTSYNSSYQYIGDFDIWTCMLIYTYKRYIQMYISMYIVLYVHISDRRPSRYMLWLSGLYTRTTWFSVSIVIINEPKYTICTKEILAELKR